MNQSQKAAQQYSLICIPNEKQLCYVDSIRPQNESSIVILTHDKEVKEVLENMGLWKIMDIDLTGGPLLFEGEVSKIILLEHSLLSTSLLLKTLKSSFTAPVTVVTKAHSYPVMLYSKLGAKYVMYTNSNRIHFLLQD